MLYERSVRDLVRGLRSLGLELWVGSDGVVHGRMAGGGKIPFEARALIDQLGMVNESAASYLNSEKAVKLEGVSAEDAVKYALAIKSGDIQLVGKVIVHKRTGLCDLTFMGVMPDGQ